MAIVKASNVVGFDIGDIDFEEILDDASIDGTSSSFTATNAAGFLLTAEGENLTYFGPFPVGGTVTSFKLSLNDQLIADISEIDLSVAAVVAAVQSDTPEEDSLALLKDVLSGNDTFTGGKEADLFGGFAGNDTFNGGDGADTIFGGDGDDRLNGGAGIDTLRGEKGDDTYAVTRGDKVIETRTGGDEDTVNAGFSYKLTNFVENLNLSNVAAAVKGVGNAEDNDIKGNRFANTLDGLGGSDKMTGLAGNDKYYFDDAGDKAIESSTGGAADAVYSKVSIRALDGNVERLFLQGTADLDAKGNQSANRITGNDGDNVLNGSFGRDTLTGDIGQDTFVFSTKLSAVNVDEITDFKVSDDTIHIDNAAFAKLAAGALGVGAFVIGTAAADGSDRVIYDSASGDLLFDRDGSATAFAAVKFAEIDTGLALTSADFLVI